jgi:hypothetical protein
MIGKKGVFIVLIFTALLLVLCSIAIAGKELPAYERFSYSLVGEANWTNTLTLMSITDSLVFEATGGIRYSRESPLVGPAGQGEAESDFPCPEFPAYSMIGKIGEDGKCFLVGDYLAMVPDEDGFLFLGINDNTPLDNAGRFNVEVSIARPICGDGTCDIAEIGRCQDDCDWCGDTECNADETCGTCSEDCGYCEADVNDINEVVGKYYRALGENDFGTLAEITTGTLYDYHNEFKRFEREFQKEIKLIGIDVENELLPDITIGELETEFSKIEDEKAYAIAKYGDSEAEVKLVKKIGWKIEDTKEEGEDDWFATDLDVNELRENHNDYLNKLSEGGIIGEAEEITVRADTTKSPLKLIIFAIIAIIVFFAVIYFIITVVKKRGSFPKFGIARKAKKVKHHDRPKKTKKCNKCKTSLYEHEKFCVECGKKVK